MCHPAQLLKLTTDQLVQLQHDALLELLRRYPPTWPNQPVYNIARRLFDVTRELHQAIADNTPTNGAKPVRLLEEDA
jgi:hypothetical protein